jgi:hypothetical protein
MLDSTTIPIIATGALTGGISRDVTTGATETVTVWTATGVAIEVRHRGGIGIIRIQKTMGEVGGTIAPRATEMTTVTGIGTGIVIEIEIGIGTGIGGAIAHLPVGTGDSRAMTIRRSK